ncbi:hypothetical protein MTO96_049371 [Rhipicephalus appendiculatus]
MQSKQSSDRHGLWPLTINCHFAGQRGHSHRLHRRWVTFGRRYDAAAFLDTNPRRLPYSGNDCIASSPGLVMTEG